MRNEKIECNITVSFLSLQSIESGLNRYFRHRNLFASGKKRERDSLLVPTDEMTGLRSF